MKYIITMEENEIDKAYNIKNAIVTVKYIYPYIVMQGLSFL